MAKKQKFSDEQLELLSNNFTNKLIDKKDASKSSYIQPNMLPPLFRSRIRLSQKIYTIIVIFFASLALGVVSYVLLNNFTLKYGLKDSQSTYFIISLIFVVIIYALSIGYVYWSRSRAYFISWNEVIGYAAPSLALTAGFIFLDTIAPGVGKVVVDKDINNLFLNIGIIGIAIGGCVAIQAFVTSMFKFRTYSTLKIKVIWTLPGLLVASSSLIIFWIFGNESVFLDIKTINLLIVFLSLIVGIMLLILGILATARYKTSGVKNNWISIKSFGSLPSLSLAIILLVIGFRFLVGINEGYLPIIIIGLFNIVVLLFFLIFVLLKGRIKNLIYANPLFNEFILKSLIIFVNMAGLIVVAVLPEITRVKSYLNVSFGVLGVTSATSSLLIIFAYFANLITFSKFFKTVAITVSSLVVTSLIVIAVLSTLESSQLIINIASRWIVIFLTTVSIACEIVLTIVNIAYVYKDILIEWKNNKLLDEVNKQKAQEVRSKKGMLV